MDSQQKEVWKQESNQLKNDLKNRPMQVIRREVEVRMPGTPSPSTLPKESPKKTTNTKLASDLLRRQLGI